MNNTTRIKKNYQLIKFQKLVVVSVLIGFLSAFLGVVLKKVTKHYEEIFFGKATLNPIFFVVFPVFGKKNPGNFKKSDTTSIHAPFTAIFLVCGLTNDYTLFLPVLAVSLISKLYSQNDLSFYGL